MHCTPQQPSLNKRTDVVRKTLFMVMTVMSACVTRNNFLKNTFLPNDLFWLVRLCQASGPPVCVIHHGRRFGSGHWLLASQMRCLQPVRHERSGMNSNTWNITTSSLCLRAFVVPRKGKHVSGFLLWKDLKLWRWKLAFHTFHHIYIKQ